MKAPPLRKLDAPIARRDIVAICAYLNRRAGTKAVDACVSNPGIFLEKAARAARMQ